MSEYQNIVIIGGSIAGHHLLNALTPTLPTSHRIILIDSKPYAQWPIATLRAAVVPGWEKRVTVPLTAANTLPKDSQHAILTPNKVVELKKGSVVLEQPFEGSTELPFFRAILATGSRQPFPMRPKDGTTEAEFQQQLIAMQGEVAKAKRVVIIGGGSVGTEMAGEIRVLYPDTSITLIHAHQQLLNPNAPPKAKTGVRSYGSPPNTLKLSTGVEKRLRDNKIDLILGEKVKLPEGSVPEGDWDGQAGAQGGLKKIRLSSGNTLEADWVFVSVGNKANSELVQSVDQGALIDGMGKMVDVDDFLKVRSTSPESVLVGGYYAIGDVASSEGFKTAQTAASDAVGAAANILNEVHGKALKKFVRPTLHAVVIPFGHLGGVGQITTPLFGTFALPNMMVKSAKAQALLVETEFLGVFKGPEKPTVGSIPAVSA